MDQPNDIMQQQNNNNKEANIPGVLVNGPSIANTSEEIKNVATRENNMLSQEHWEFINSEVEYLDRYIALADVKAGLIFGITSGILAYLIDKKGLFETLNIFACSFEWVLSLVCFFTLFISAALGFWVVAPRLIYKKRKGIVFFKAIAEYGSSKRYLSALKKMDFQEILIARINHTYSLANICTIKYNLLLKAMYFGGASIVLSFIWLLRF